MGAWSGWLEEMIDGLGIPDTSENRSFLYEWMLNERNTCQFNPLVASQKESGSTNCARLNGANTAQAYDTHADAIRATRAQLFSGDYSHLADALRSGDPLSGSNLAGLSLDLQRWGATVWQQKISKGYNLPGGSFGAPTTAHVAFAWSRWMRALGHSGPAAHRRVVRASRRASRIAR